MTPALLPSGLQSQGPTQTTAQFPSPTQQVSQWFASPGTQHFTSIATGFTPATQSALVLVIDPPVSKSLGGSSSELTGQPTPPKMQTLATSSAVLVTEAIAIPMTGTTKTIGR
jgi:hypothetical protein